MPEQPKKINDRDYYLFALRIVGDFGTAIAIPVLVLVLLGQYIDEQYATEPWFKLGGFILAALISCKMIYKKTKQYGQQYQDMNKK